MKILEIENLTKTFIQKSITSKKLLAIDSISFYIENGKSIGIIGESGCGKSTLLKLIMGFLKPDSGTIKLFNNNLKTHLDLKTRQWICKNMQVVMQDPYASLNPKLKLKEILYEGLTNFFPKKEIYHNIEKIFSDCKIPMDSLEKFPNEFSGGQRQRIAIAKALLFKPKILLLDEPTSALDVSIQAQIINLLLDLKESYNLTYLFISHDLRIVKFFCDEIFVMKNGKFLEHGTSKEIFENPTNDYTKNLILNSNLDRK